MDPDQLALQLQNTQIAVAMLIGCVLVMALYIATRPFPGETPKRGKGKGAVVICPLHRIDRDLCDKQHQDEE